MPFPLHIEQIAYGGRGVARHEGKVCFIPGVLPGETVEAELIRDHGSYIEAKALSLLSPSPSRIPTTCPLALSIPKNKPTHTPRPPVCPGCCYQHMAYETELQIKQDHLCQLLERHLPSSQYSMWEGRSAPRQTAHSSEFTAPSYILPPVASPLSLGYRNKMALHVQRDGSDLRLGYFMEDNTTIIDVPACPLAMPQLNDLLAERRRDGSFMHSLRNDMNLTFRWTERDGATWWRGRAAENDIWLVESSPVGPLSVPRNSFYQTNPAVARLLVEEVMRLLATDHPDRVIDLYCGVGIFALAAAHQGFSKVIGLDVDGPALKAAEYNAKKLGHPEIQWIAGSAHKTSLASLKSNLPTTAIVDPPRTGLGRAMIKQLTSLAPSRILYISCAADTMARDVAWLKESGFTVKQSQLFDMFPRTPHFESLTELAL